MADDILLSSDAVGYEFDDETKWFTVQGAWTELSAHGLSASGIVPQMLAQRSGRIIDFGMGVIPATSASGFITGTATTHLFINGASIFSNAPVIAKAGSTGQHVRTFVNTSTTSTAFVNPAVLNTASATVNVGDQIGAIYDLQSVGSAAAGAAGTGYYAYVTIRYAAR